MDNSVDSVINWLAGTVRKLLKRVDALEHDLTVSKTSDSLAALANKEGFVPTRIAAWEPLPSADFTHPYDDAISTMTSDAKRCAGGSTIYLENLVSKIGDVEEIPSETSSSHSSDPHHDFEVSGSLDANANAADHCSRSANAASMGQQSSTAIPNDNIEWLPPGLFGIGDILRLHGLSTDDLNDKYARVIGHVPSSCRIRVRILDTNRIVSVRTCNLQSIAVSGDCKSELMCASLVPDTDVGLIANIFLGKATFVSGGPSGALAFLDEALSGNRVLLDDVASLFSRLEAEADTPDASLSGRDAAVLFHALASPGTGELPKSSFMLYAFITLDAIRASWD